MLVLLLALLLASPSPTSSAPVATPSADDVVASGAMPWWDEQPRFVRRLLSGGQLSADGWPAGVVVAKGGGGHHETIAKALAEAPKGRGRYVIRIKAGVYLETLNITRKNVVLIGDGVGKTVITGNLSNATDTPMIWTGTVNALGHGFVAMNLTVRNTAGPEGKQAVALRTNSNKSVIYGCSIEGFQDTLYAENNLQLFVDCDISGTVDFVYGNAKAVFVGCRLLSRNPKDPRAHNVVTAQGRDSPLHDSGFVFINCNVTAYPGDNLAGVDTFLGRPWKNHSHVVFMGSFLDDIINATAWVSWKRDQPAEETMKTVAYLEYKNWGPKANTDQRVKWPGFRLISATTAQDYTVDHFIGNKWVPPLVHYNDTLPI